MTAKENKTWSSCSERACWPLSKPEMERPKQGGKISHESWKEEEKRGTYHVTEQQTGKSYAYADVLGWTPAFQLCVEWTTGI